MIRTAVKKIKKVDFKLKVYKIGKVKGNLSRTEIYQDVWSHSY